MANMGRATILAAAALGMAAPAMAQDIAPTVTVEAGTLAGATKDGVDSWKGIPFAAPPVGENRWRAPQPAAAWEGVRDATAYGHDCMQKPFPSDAAPLGSPVSEDCLVMNVWRPEGVSADAKLPVMVWIYGGGFVNGGSSPDVYSGKHFAQEGIVFVSFNYRLGRFGFFAHPALAAAGEEQGNFGYMDQIAALKWVQANIAQFGGDPDNVTVFGESAGGGSTLTVLTSPETKGMFDRVAVMSGGGRGLLMGPRAVSEDVNGAISAEKIGLNFARAKGIEGTDAQALAQLRALSADDVLDGLNMAGLFTPPGAELTYARGPMIDGTIVPAGPDTIIASGEAAKVPVMIGSTTADIGFPPARTKDAMFAAFGANSQKARAAYDPDGDADDRTVLMLAGADIAMNEPARHVAELVTRQGAPAYFYRFGYVADSMKSQWASGAPHATDIPWAFNTIDAKYGDDVTEQDRDVARTFHGYFVNFAKSGNPAGEGLPEWPTFADAPDTVMQFEFGGNVAAVPDPWADRLDLVEAMVTRGSAPTE